VLADHDIGAYTICMQYSVRGIPPEVDRAIRERAKVLGKSLNEVAILALAEGVGLGSERVVRRDLEGIAGTWRRETSVERALAAQDEVDEALWK
jgi:hypothetical protein